MTLQERDERMREEGRKEGTEIATLNSIKNLMETMAISAEKAMDLVKIPAEERERYLTKL